MKTFEIKTFPDPCLRIKVKPVDKFDDDLKETVRLMSEVMYLNQGIGLAAPQVGLGLNLFIVDLGEGLLTFINPEIVSRSGQKGKMEEGCLSLPGLSVNVSRAEKVEVKACNIDGEIFLRKYDGLMAKVIQHEMDHLNGTMLIDKLNPVAHFVSRRKLTRLKRGRASCSKCK